MAAYLFFGVLGLAAFVLLIFGKGLERAIVGGFGLLLLAAVVFPSIRPARPIAFRNACVANLKLIQDAKARWAAKNKKSSNDIPADTDLFGEGAYVCQKPECPSGGSYQLGAVGQKASCSEIAKGHRLE